MIALLLALAALPSELAVTGTPGGEFTIDLELIGSGHVSIESTPPITYNKDITVEGKTPVHITGRVSTGARPGIYNNYVYIQEISEQQVQTAIAIPTTVTINTVSKSTTVARTKDVYGTSYFWYGAGVLAIVIFGAVVFMIHRSRQ